MTRRFELTPSAEQDIAAITTYVDTRFGYERAKKLRSDLLRSFRLLAERPGIGRSRPDLWGPPYRFWPLGPMLIAYRVESTAVQIVRVARASRDWSNLPERLPRSN
jgi:plasmid stabilization system protein ParE